MTWLKIEAPQGLTFLYKTSDDKYLLGCYKGIFGNVYCLKNKITGKISNFTNINDAQRAAWAESMWGESYACGVHD